MGKIKIFLQSIVGKFSAMTLTGQIVTGVVSTVVLVGGITVGVYTYNKNQENGLNKPNKEMEQLVEDSKDMTSAEIADILQDKDGELPEEIVKKLEEEIDNKNKKEDSNIIINNSKEEESNNGGTSTPGTNGGSNNGGTSTPGTNGGGNNGGTSTPSTNGGSNNGGTSTPGTNGGSNNGGTSTPGTNGGSNNGGTSTPGTNGGGNNGGTSTPSKPSDDKIDVSDIPPAKYMLNGTAKTLMTNYGISGSYNGNRFNEITDVTASFAKGAIDFNTAKRKLVGKVTDNGTLRIKNVKYKSADYSMTDPMKTTYQYADEVWKANGFLNYKPSSSVAFDTVLLVHLDQNENMRLYRIIVEFEKI